MIRHGKVAEADKQPTTQCSILIIHVCTSVNDSIKQLFKTSLFRPSHARCIFFHANNWEGGKKKKSNCWVVSHRMRVSRCDKTTLLFLDCGWFFPNFSTANKCTHLLQLQQQQEQQQQEQNQLPWQTSSSSVSQHQASLDKQDAKKKKKKTTRTTTILKTAGLVRVLLFCLTPKNTSETGCCTVSDVCFLLWGGKTPK